MKPKKLLFIIGGLIVVGIVVAVLTSLFPQMVKQDLAASASTVTPTAAPLEPMVRARGSIEPARSATLAFETSGTIVEWSVKEGDTVKAGDVLGRLDTT